jgi:3-oxoacyl-[acyl-carrier protein] reductase
MSRMTADFTGSGVIVTGAARGVGLSIACAFSDAGATVHMVDFDADALHDAAEKVRGIPHVADVSDTRAVEAVVQAAAAHEDDIQVVVNNAGLLRDRMIWKLTDEDWSSVLDVHLGGTFRFTRAAVPHLRRQGGGRIVNVTSYTGLHGNPGQANYAAAKAGIIGLTKTSAKELARFGITVNAISPNADTRMIESIPPDVRAGIEAAIPLGRIADASEMAYAVLFLASSQASYVTGTVLPVDGGLAM